MDYNNVHILDHPLILHKLAIIRRKDTGVKEFREMISEIATLMCYEATRNLQTETVTIETPVAEAQVQVLAGKKLAIVPILRAGLGMVDGMLSLIPSAKVGHIGLYRDPDSLEPVEYYCKLPPDIQERDVIDFLKARGVRSIKMLNIIAAPEGVEKVALAHPDVEIYCAALDQCLNDHGYIVPGLGDAGDRIFGTK